MGKCSCHTLLSRMENELKIMQISCLTGEKLWEFHGQKRAECEGHWWIIINRM